MFGKAIDCDVLKQRNISSRSMIMYQTIEMYVQRTEGAYRKLCVAQIYLAFMYVYMYGFLAGLFCYT